MKYSINSDAFEFLSRCTSAKYDITSAEPLRPSKNGINIPQTLMETIRHFDDRDYVEVHGESRGEDYILDEVVTFFCKRGIKANRSNISLCDSILSAIYKVFDKLELQQNSKIIVPVPTFGYYFKQLNKKGIDFEILSTKSEDGFLPNAMDLDELLTQSGSRVVLMCYPNNPTGVVMTENKARELAEVIKKHNAFVISDEAFMNNLLFAQRHFPIAAVEGMVEYSLTITSMAKSVCMGRKTGFCVGKEDIVSSFERLGGYPTKQDQRVLAASMKDNEENFDYSENCRKYYMQNIETIKEKLTDLSCKFSEQFLDNKIYVKPLIENPEATNVYVLDFSGLRGKVRNGKSLQTGLDIAEWLLEDASVGVVPGECFLFKPDEMLVRIVLNQTPTELYQAFDSIMQAAENIRNPERVIYTESSIPSASASSANASALKVGELVLIDGAGI